jgi:hypothetical protein
MKKPQPSRLSSSASIVVEAVREKLHQTVGAGSHSEAQRKVKRRLRDASHRLGKARNLDVYIGRNTVPHTDEYNFHKLARTKFKSTRTFSLQPTHQQEHSSTQA